VNKSARDETSCPLTLNAKGHCPGVVAIVGMSLMLISYDHGRLAHDETPYPFWEKVIFFYLYLFILLLFYYYFILLYIFRLY
jgi:hypothetical protein